LAPTVSSVVNTDFPIGALGQQLKAARTRSLLRKMGALVNDRDVTPPVAGIAFEGSGSTVDNAHHYPPDLPSHRPWQRVEGVLK
jgi:hypothetical protein